MLILNIKNNELTAKEVSNDTLNIKDSNLFARGVNTILASGEKAGLERWFWSRYKLTTAAIKKMNYVLTPDESHEYESADFEKAALLNQLDDFMSNQTITLPCVNVVNEAALIKKKLRKEYEEFDVGMYLLVLMGLLCGIVVSLLLADLSQTLTF